jgi:hypothetical protein
LPHEKIEPRISRTPADGTRWFNEYDELVGFASVLLAADAFAEPEAQSVIYYFEKPWNYDREHQAWVKHGRPTGAEYSDAWDNFRLDIEPL